ncbi:unnamed protein product, partial [Phaeothamnion confervicola]
VKYGDQLSATTGETKRRLATLVNWFGANDSEPMADASEPDHVNHLRRRLPRRHRHNQRLRARTVV